MTPARLTEIEQKMRRHGPASCWAGAAGAWSDINELLTEVKRLQAIEAKYIAWRQKAWSHAKFLDLLEDE